MNALTEATLLASTNLSTVDPDTQLVAACAAFQNAMRAHDAANADPTLTEERSQALWKAKNTWYDEVIRLPARSPKALKAKAAALETALRSDVPEYLDNTFWDNARPHERLAESLCRDLLNGSTAA